MKARKVDLRQTVATGGGKAYNPKDTIKAVLFNPQRQLNASGLIEASELWDEIKGEKDEVLLEEVKWQKLVGALEQVKGFGEGDVAFVKGLMAAEEVEVKEEK